MRFFLIFAALATSNAAQALSLEELTQKVVQLEDSKFMDSYMKEYYADLPAASARVTDCGSLVSLSTIFPFILVGDEHSTDSSVVLVESIARHLVAQKQTPTLVIEFVFHKHQYLIDQYLGDKITLAQLRQKIGWDKMNWSWHWEQISRVLKLGKDLKLRVISGEEGSNNMDTRDTFTVSTIKKDWQQDGKRTYIVLYGTMHILGADHIGGLMTQEGLTPHLRFINFLGRHTATAVQAAGSDSAKCLSLQGDLYFAAPRTPFEELEDYYNYMKQF